ncbi:MAG: hypothetical protein WAU44_17785 [Nitrospira sp.]|jgi:hypothetical protein|uniref:hypothetical protein n=1 Tax=Nitrospira sp. ND1 TaxID=1658518 RepID=UPI0009BB5CBD|nr:hypothetical protein [Nitrospira sp. ND1]MBK7420299.1 hypothetical protein [Nitrospira sp.]OYT23728.1 MAG: hypothetical protein CCU27_07815 [Nitrospira sp. UW-LDO-02]MBP7361641.1 hypothetical protein [Nitrospira sp.]MBP8201507.1 hypothetical protein [Nitrospira sp.]MBP9635673.1 hypothetical protein [Nitrospira sp.]
MVQRTAEVTVPHDNSSGPTDPKEPPAGAVPGPDLVASNGPTPLRCPTHKCNGLLSTDASGYDPYTGLDVLVCTQCKHRGFRSREGVILLFRGGYEFKFSYGPSLQTITVVLSSASVNLWSTHGVNDEQLAKIAAEWSLLCGNTTKRVHLGIPAEEFADFYLYFCQK